VSRRRLVVSDVSGQGTRHNLKVQQALEKILNFILVKILSNSCHVDRHVDVEANILFFLIFGCESSEKKICSFSEIEPRLGQTVARHCADWATGMRRITMIRSTTDRIYNGGPIIQGY
jgi:hypothetical protein